MANENLQSGSVHGFAPHFKKKPITQRGQSYVKSSPASVSKDNVKNVSPQKSFSAVFESKENVKNVSPTLRPVVEMTEKDENGCASVTRSSVKVDEPQPSL